jgi:hypothetical protein
MLFRGRRIRLLPYLYLPHLLSLNFPHLLDLSFALNRDRDDGGFLHLTMSTERMVRTRLPRLDPRR